MAESTYGAQPGDRIGDLGLLYEMEQQEGKVHTLYPPDFKMPMVAPHDIGQIAAHLMT